MGVQESIDQDAKGSRNHLESSDIGPNTPPNDGQPATTKIDLAHCHYVTAAARAGSFRRAADLLDISQPNLSRAIRKLEDRLGVSIFERSHSGVRLTSAGQRFLREAVPAIEQLELALDAARAAGRAELGTLRIGILTSLAGGFLRRLIHCYTVKHPKIAVDVHDGGRSEHLAAIHAHQLDVAFLTGNSSFEECESAELWRERVYVAMSEEHVLASEVRLDWPELKRERFIVSRSEPGPEVQAYIVRRAADYSTYPRVEQKNAFQDTLMNLVSLGQGITLVSAAWSAVSVPGLVLRPLTAREDIVPFSAVWSSRNDNPALRRFLTVAHLLSGKHRQGTSDWATPI